MAITVLENLQKTIRSAPLSIACGAAVSCDPTSNSQYPPTLTTHPLAPAIFITGPTASGKSLVAARLAQKLNGEVVNADPYQSYQKLPILTAQPETGLRELAPHHLYGITPLDHDLSAPTFAEIVNQKAAELIVRDVTPIIVTGSGLYFRALTHGIDTSIPPAEPKLRAELENTPIPELIDRLYSLDPVSADTIDIHNPHRVVRALEICLLTGKPASELRSGFDPQDIAWLRGIYLDVDRQFLHQRIATRAEHMFSIGVEQEVAALANTPLSKTAQNTLGLDLVRDVLSGNLPRQGAIDLLTIATRQYAKRQHTWFKKVSALSTIPVDANSEPDNIVQQVGEVLGDRC